jgi:hypothetical protein
MSGKEDYNTKRNNKKPFSRRLSRAAEPSILLKKITRTQGKKFPNYRFGNREKLCVLFKNLPD